MILSVSVRAQTEKFHAQAVDRKREKEASRQRRDQLQAIRDLEARAEAENLSRDVKPSYQELADARALRDRVRHPPPPSTQYSQCFFFKRVARLRSWVLI